MEKAGKLGPDEQRRRNEGDPRRDAGGQESVQSELERQTEVPEEEQQYEEEEEETALILARFMAHETKEEYQ